jgi:hypothetical protein
MGDKGSCMLCLVWYTVLPTHNYDELVNGFVSNKEKKMKKMRKSDADRRSITRTATSQSKFHSSGT